MEDNLIEADIVKINYEAKSNQVFKISSLRVFSKPNPDFRDIIAISDKELILIRGNSKTGYEHIRERHGFWTIKAYTDGDKFQAQSKFPKDILPIDYIKIADEVYLPENLLIDNEHKDANQFEKYVGHYIFDGENEEVVNLVLYSGTKIIHSLYPQNKKYNKNRNKGRYPYVRGEVRVEVNNKNQITEIFVPFLDTDLKQKYGLVIERFYEKKIEDWNVLIFDESGEIKDIHYFGNKKLTFFRGEKSAKTTLQFCDLKSIETLLLNIDKL